MVVNDESAPRPLSTDDVEALARAAELIADDYRDDTRGGTWTIEIGRAVRKAWIAGRNWGAAR